MRTYTVPKKWGLTLIESEVICLLIDYPGEYITVREMCGLVYGEDLDRGTPAPAKLRVLVQRCRRIVENVAGLTVEIEIKRGKGWRISRRNVLRLKRYFDKSSKDERRN